MKNAAFILTVVWGLLVLCLLLFLSLDRPMTPVPYSQAVASHPRTATELEREDAVPAAKPRRIVPASSTRARAYHFDIQGNEKFPEWIIRRAVRLLVDADAEASIAYIREAVRRFYLAYGYINVQVSCQIVPGEPPLVQVEIEEGKRFVWDEFQIESKTLPEEGLRQFFATEKGHTVNMLEHVQSLADLADAFQEQGYLSFSYVPDVRFDEQLGTFSTKINVKEGPQYILADVSLESPEARSIMNDLIGRPCSMFDISRRLTRLGLEWGDVKVVRNAERGEVYIRSKSAQKTN
jgi:hypothetical protein